MNKEIVGNLKIEMEPISDKHGNDIYIGRLEAPVLLKADRGIAFLLFTSEEGNEELQITYLNSDNGSYSTYYQSGDKLKIKMVKRLDAEKNVFYVAKVKFDGLIDLAEDCSFMAFLSREGKEELQLEADLIEKPKVEPEIVYRR